MQLSITNRRPTGFKHCEQDFVLIDLNDKRVLVIRLSALGDVIRTLPAVLGLQERYPTARITWLCEDASSGLLKGLDGVDLICINRKAMRASNPLTVWREFRRVIREIRQRQFHLSIDFHGILKSAMMPWFAGISTRVGFLPKGSKEQAHIFYNHRVVHSSSRVSRYERNLELARYFGDDIAQLAPEIPLSSEAEQVLKRAMSLEPILLIPGTSKWGQYKQWPVESWEFLFRKLKEKYPVTWVFGPADGYFRDELQKRLGDDFSCLPKLSIPELAHALRRSRLIVVGDTGPMHLASVVKAPLLALMGPSDSVIAQPLMAPFGHPLTRMFVPDVPCAPCRNRSCKDLICQTFTTPGAILEQVELMLEKPDEIKNPS